MSRRRIKVKAIRKKNPDVRLYALALIELAQTELEAEAQAEAHEAADGGKESGHA